RDELLKFLPYVSIITPNLAEAQLLLQKDIETVEEMKQAAVTLYDLGAKAVVIKGGNRLDGSEAIDVFYDGQEVVVLQSPLLSENNVGAG
ncbi:PfkB family carbohydrate kinase, partial [Streptococcus suis]